MMLDSAVDTLVPDNDAGFEPTCQWFTEKNKECFLNNSFYDTIKIFSKIL